MTETFEQLEAKVIAWAKARQIIPNSSAKAQLIKLLEERGEAITALYDLNYAGVMLDGVGFEDARRDLVDAFGDMLVCVINAAALADVSLTEALAHAYDQIKDRKGTLGPDGIFYKDQP